MLNVHNDGILKVNSETVIRHPETPEGSGFLLINVKDDPQGQL